MLDVTFTEIVQPPAGIVDVFAYVIVEAPAFAVAVPGHVFDTPGVEATTRFVGSVSVSAAVSVSSNAFVFPSVNVSTEATPTGVEAGEKDLPTVGRSRTVSTAWAWAAFSPASVFRSFALIVFV